MLRPVILVLSSDKKFYSISIFIINYFFFLLGEFVSGVGGRRYILKLFSILYNYTYSFWINKSKNLNLYEFSLPIKVKKNFTVINFVDYVFTRYFLFFLPKYLILV